jgi:MFS family permease
VSTAVPTIVADLKDASGYTWIGTSYVLAGTVPLPLYGKASDIWGRKPILFVSIGLFEIGSALCGASQSMNMLIASRVIQGMGGGGIMGLVNIILSDLVSLRYTHPTLQLSHPLLHETSINFVL